MAFVGMQPVFTQVPPNSLRSMIATFLPAAARRRANGGPACPVPMRIASNEVGITLILAQLLDVTVVVAFHFDNVIPAEFFPHRKGHSKCAHRSANEARRRN